MRGVSNRKYSWILWMLVILFIFALMYLHYYARSTAGDGFDSCKNPDACSKWIPRMYIGYNQTFMLDKDSSNNILNANELSNYCFSINGNNRKIKLQDLSADNYILNVNGTFDCIDPWRIPDKIPQTGPVVTTPVYSYYDLSSNFNTIKDTSKYCADITGYSKVPRDKSGNIINNFKIVPNDNDPSKTYFKCRNPVDPNFVIDYITPVWNYIGNNTYFYQVSIDDEDDLIMDKFYAKNISDISNVCYNLNGHHAAPLIDPTTNESKPLVHDISFNKNMITFNCNSYWGKNANDSDGVVTPREYSKDNIILHKYDWNVKFNDISYVKQYCSNNYTITPSQDGTPTFVCGTNMNPEFKFEFELKNIRQTPQFILPNIRL